jgi:hypothetical protein
MKPIFNSGHSLAKTRIKLSGFPPHIVGVAPRGRRRSTWTVTETGGPYGVPSSWGNRNPQGSPITIKQRPERAAATQVNGVAVSSQVAAFPGRCFSGKQWPTRVTVGCQTGHRIRGGNAWGWVAATHKGVVARVFFSAFRVFNLSIQIRVGLGIR